MAAVLLTASCSKDDENNAPENVKPQSGISFSIRVNTGNSLKKLGYAESTEEGKTGYYNISFTEDDKNLEMKIYNGEELLTILHLTDVANCEFTGTVETVPDDDAELTAVITTGNDQSPTYSDKSLEDLLKNCAHTFKTQKTFKYGTEEIYLTDQNTYLAISMSPCCEHKIKINSSIDYTVKDGRIWVAVPASKDLKIEGLGKELQKTASEVLPGTINTVARQYFSVSADKKVYFSPGNLQYKPNPENGENPWRFAEHQYDIIGYDNKNITSETYKGFIDLFGWGTWLTGGNPTNVSLNTSDYQWNNSNTSAIGSEWETLTGCYSTAEWYYLCFFRKDKDNAFLYGEGSINGVNGVILLPDDWSQPTDLSFTPRYSDWSNNYDSETWAKMESAGAVFLPAAGCRYGSELSDVGSHGNYWSSTVNGDNRPGNLSFYSNYVYPGGASFHVRGHSVRLVRPL